MTQFNASHFKYPCERLPDDPRLAKLLGVYPQRQDGRFMQRVKVPGGRLLAGQWSALGLIVRDLTPQTPLHLTTRQDIELHDLSPEQVPLAQRRLADAALSTVGGGGDTLRNVTVCPCSGARAGTVDLLPLALHIQHALWDYERIFELPRKFKISLSACDRACGQPFINDLGLVAVRSAERWGFRVIGAGSLGPRPATGVVLFDWLPAEDALPLALAAVRLFDAHGQRINRATARLRHIRQRVGDEQFRSLLGSELAAVRSAAAGGISDFGFRISDLELPALRVTSLELPRLPVSDAVRNPKSEIRNRLWLTFPNGDVWPDAAEALARLAARAELDLRITGDHRVVVFGPSDQAVADAVEAEPSLRAAAQPQPNVVACPGSRWCKRALVDTNRVADQVRRELAEMGGGVRGSGIGIQGSGIGDRGSASKEFVPTPAPRHPTPSRRPTPDPSSFEVRISGCPNGCAHSAVAPVGLVGRLVTVADRREEAFDLLVGGDLGRSPTLARPAEQAVLAESAAQRIMGLQSDRG